jgi:hypothetical protein
LCVEQRTESKKRRKREKRPFDDRHPTAGLLIEHPHGNHELISAGKKQLNPNPKPNPLPRPRKRPSAPSFEGRRTYRLSFLLAD